MRKAAAVTVAQKRTGCSTAQSSCWGFCGLSSFLDVSAKAGKRFCFVPVLPLCAKVLKYVKVLENNGGGGGRKRQNGVSCQLLLVPVFLRLRS